jgi:hypothetical protein
VTDAIRLVALILGFVALLYLIKSRENMFMLIPTKTYLRTSERAWVIFSSPTCVISAFILVSEAFAKVVPLS